ncbi:hypothetical protein PhaeoP78_03907 (plasmid) [Phaeobacter inhibens]|nr:hypothetical protein PhaeoP78_03907 [Phaeobacter inhibens]
MSSGSRWTDPGLLAPDHPPQKTPPAYRPGGALGQTAAGSGYSAAMPSGDAEPGASPRSNRDQLRSPS